MEGTYRSWTTLLGYPTVRKQYYRTDIDVSQALSQPIGYLSMYAFVSKSIWFFGYPFRCTYSGNCDGLFYPSEKKTTRGSGGYCHQRR